MCFCWSDCNNKFHAVSASTVPSYVHRQPNAAHQLRCDIRNRLSILANRLCGTNARPKLLRMCAHECGGCGTNVHVLTNQPFAVLALLWMKNGKAFACATDNIRNAFGNFRFSSWTPKHCLPCWWCDFISMHFIGIGMAQSANNKMKIVGLCRRWRTVVFWFYFVNFWGSRWNSDRRKIKVKEIIGLCVIKDVRENRVFFVFFFWKIIFSKSKWKVVDCDKSKCHNGTIILIYMNLFILFSWFDPWEAN